MDVTSIVVLVIFGASSVAALVMFGRLARMANEGKPAAARHWALNMSLVTGIWELSVAAIIIDKDSWGQAIGPLMLGVAMVAARWIVPALKRRIG